MVTLSKSVGRPLKSRPLTNAERQAKHRANAQLGNFSDEVSKLWPDLDDSRRYCRLLSDRHRAMRDSE